MVASWGLATVLEFGQPTSLSFQLSGSETVRGSKGSQPCRLLLMVCLAVLTAGILQARKAPGGHCAPVPRSEDPSGRPTAVQGREDRHHPEE